MENIHSDNYYLDMIRFNIKKYRKKLNITQQELVDRSSLSMNYIAKIEIVINLYFFAQEKDYKLVLSILIQTAKPYLNTAMEFV